MLTGRSTYFAGTDNVVTVQSFHPCHLFGDSDLYGIGVQCGFYLQYSAMFIALIGGVERQLANIRIAFTITAGAIFVSLCVNSNGETLGILDWIIANLLFLPFSFVASLPFATSYPIQLWLERQAAHYKSIEAIIEEKRLETSAKLYEIRGKVFYEAVWAREAAAAAGKEVDRRKIKAKAFRRIDRFIEQMEDGDTKEALKESASRAKARNDIETAAFESLQQDFLRPGQQLPLTRQEHELELEFSERAKEWSANKVKKNAYIKLSEEYGYKQNHDSLALASVLLVFLVYAFVTPFLYWKLFSRGRVEGCDVKIVFWFVPVSIYNHKLLVLLRVVAGFSLFYSLLLFLTTVFLVRGACAGYAKERREKGVGNAYKKAGIPQDKNASPSDKSSSDSGEESTPQNDKEKVNSPGDASTSKANTVEGKMVEIREFIRDDILTSYGIWAFFLAFSLAFTIALVTRTIQSNHIDMNKAPLSSTGQLVPFFTGLVVFFLVLWDLIMDNIEKHAKDMETKKIKKRTTDLETGLRKETKGAELATPGKEMIRHEQSS